VRHTGGNFNIPSSSVNVSQYDIRNELLNVNTAVQLLKQQETEKAICRDLQTQIQKRETERKEQNVDTYRPTPHIFVTLKRRRSRRQRQLSVHKVGVYDVWPNGNGLKGS
jgi:hypothetical protein